MVAFTLQLIPLIWELGQNFLQNLMSGRYGPVKCTETTHEWKHTKRLQYYILLDKLFTSNWNQSFGMQVHKCDKCDILHKSTWSNTAPRLLTHCWNSDYSQTNGSTWTWDKPCPLHEENNLSYTYMYRKHIQHLRGQHQQDISQYKNTLKLVEDLLHLVLYIKGTSSIHACMQQTCDQAQITVKVHIYIKKYRIACKK